MISYLLVFQGSTPITEWISGSKYPEYKQYKKRVGRFLPSLGYRWNEEEMAQLGTKSVDKKTKEDGGKKQT